jgi:hypothetical protein
MTELVGIEIDRKRGDTAPDEITVPFDNTGFSYILTINTQKNPDAGGPIGAILVTSVGAIGGADGLVSFPFTPTDADQAIGKYWYDVQQTDPTGRIKTIAKNSYIYHQDITK